MSDSFTIEHQGVEYTVTPKKRTALIEMMTDYQFSAGCDVDDPDYIYSAFNTTALSALPLDDLLVESINDMPLEEVTDSELKLVASFAVMGGLYADTDLVESMRKSAKIHYIMRPAWDAVMERLKNGTLLAENRLTVGFHNAALQSEARKLPKVMQQLQALGDDCPEWAKEDKWKTNS
ncbi:MAG: hypothetical protein OXG53_11240 [Chloroflexi bacterium]|nr:hypothetical protein [Chloroflexota bacterium]